MEIHADSVSVDSSHPYRLKVNLTGTNFSDVPFSEMVSEYPVDEILEEIDVDEAVSFYDTNDILKHIDIVDAIAYYGEDMIREALDGKSPDVNDFNPNKG